MTPESKRFEDLIKVIEQMAAGNLDARFPVTHSRDDLDAIGYGVNQLAEELSVTIRRLEHEVSERRSAQANLASAEQRRVEARREAQSFRTARLASIGVLAAGIGHEINNPLTYVIGNLDFLEQQISENRSDQGSDLVAEMREVLSEAIEGTDRIRRIVGDLKIFSRVDGDRDDQCVDVEEVLESSLALVNNEVRHRAKLVRDYRPIPLISINTSRLGQVLVNLLVNAAHSIREGEASENEICVALREAEEGGVVLEIRDTGVGIPEADLPRVFEPFFSSKSKGEGTGLGLAICRELVFRMKGQIEVESDDGRGTTVRVSLPSGQLIEPEGEKRLEGPGSVGRPARVLIIDDEQLVARSLERLLGECAVTIAAGGVQGLSILEEQNGFDVVFCDLMMPDVSGMEVYESLRATEPAQAERFVFVTGGAFTERARHFIASIRNPCIQKPFDAAELHRLVRERASVADGARVG